MTVEQALGAVSLVAGATFWWVYLLQRRVRRLEQEAGLREPERPLYD